MIKKYIWYVFVIICDFELVFVCFFRVYMYFINIIMLVEYVIFCFLEFFVIVDFDFILRIN